MAFLFPSPTLIKPVDDTDVTGLRFSNLLEMSEDLFLFFFLGICVCVTEIIWSGGTFVIGNSGSNMRRLTIEESF